MQEDVSRIKRVIDNAVPPLYGLEESQHNTLDWFYFERFGKSADALLNDWKLPVVHPKETATFALGLSFGRWDIRLAKDLSLVPALPDPFDPLPICPPAMLVGTDGLPAREDNIASETWLRARPNAISLPPVPAGSQKITAVDYPINIPWDGILVDDPDDERDIVKKLQAVLRVLHGSEADAKERELLAELGANDLREYLGKPGRFFAEHLSCYTESPRKAPIYWPLQTDGGRFTLWIYYPRLTQDTLFACINIVDRKLSLERRKLELARNDLNETEGRSERLLVEQLEEFTSALSEMKEELECVTTLPYKPNLDDGVMITASPLWKLFRHAPWQKEVRSCWEKLEEGDYDWAHLAFAIWPDRVQKKCRKDRSLAIAHGLESICEQKPPQVKGEGKKRGRKVKGVVESTLDFEEDEE